MKTIAQNSLETRTAKSITCGQREINFPQWSLDLNALHHRSLRYHEQNAQWRCGNRNLNSVFYE